MHMKNFLNNKLLVGVISFLVLAGFVNAVAMIKLSSTSQSAGVALNTSTIGRPTKVVYGPESNDFGAGTGIVFGRKQTVTVNACAAGAGGGGGGYGWETGSNVGNGGAGGGGGGKGQCKIMTYKVAPGDVMHWNVGWGGYGGLPAEILVDVDGYGPYDFDTDATWGGNGGWTYVSINGVDVMQLEGGHAGNPGQNGSAVGAIGGLGGSTTMSTAMWHKGQNGYLSTQTPHSCLNAGYGGWGGNGETNSGDGSAANAGVGGHCVSVWGQWGFNWETMKGGDAGSGGISFGGGGGGGGLGRWQDLGANNSPQVHQKGGWGGPGGNGTLEITY